MVQLQKYHNTFLLIFFVSPQIVQNGIALTHFFQHVPHVENTFRYKCPCVCLLFVCIKGKLVLFLDKTGNVSQETIPKFIDSQIFYFHLHYKLFCIKAMHLSDKVSLTCPRSWPIEDICICLYALKRLLKVWHIFEKVVSMQYTFEGVLEKQGRVELRYGGNCVAKTVLVESAHQFSLEELCRTRYSLEYFSTPYRPSDCLENPLNTI